MSAGFCKSWVPKIHITFANFNLGGFKHIILGLVPKIGNTSRADASISVFSHSCAHLIWYLAADHVLDATLVGSRVIHTYQACRPQ